jgi:hypothetical protein
MLSGKFKRGDILITKNFNNLTQKNQIKTKKSSQTCSLSYKLIVFQISYNLSIIDTPSNFIKF